MGKVFADKETPLVLIENIFALISWKETLMRRTHTDSISMSCIHYTLYLYAHCAFLHTGSMGVLINVLKGAGLSWGSVLQANDIESLGCKATTSQAQSLLIGDDCERFVSVRPVCWQCRVAQ